MALVLLMLGVAPRGATDFMLSPPRWAVKSWKDVDEYIAVAPKEVRPKLKQVRAAIREVAPDAVESISYGMPFYSHKGEQGFKGRLVYFGLLKARIALYMRPEDLEGHIDEVARYMTAKSALQFPLDETVPVSLIKELVGDAVRRHEAGRRDSRSTGTRQGSGRAMDPMRTVAGT
jgi:uncharacterized protein YdhG (YjbR/CyaY superfamily)